MTSYQGWAQTWLVWWLFSPINLAIFHDWPTSRGTDTTLFTNVNCLQFHRLLSRLNPSVYIVITFLFHMGGGFWGVINGPRYRKSSACSLFRKACSRKLVGGGRQNIFPVVEVLWITNCRRVRGERNYMFYWVVGLFSVLFLQNSAFYYKII